MLLLFYVVGAAFSGFFSTADIARRNPDHALAPPQRIHLFHEGRLRAPFVYGTEVKINPDTFRRTYVEERSTIYPIRFFTQGRRVPAGRAVRRHHPLHGSGGAGHAVPVRDRQPGP